MTFGLVTSWMESDHERRMLDEHADNCAETHRDQQPVILATKMAIQVKHCLQTICNDEKGAYFLGSYEESPFRGAF